MKNQHVTNLPVRLSRQAGMTLLEIMIVLTIIALVMGVLLGPRVFKALSGGTEDVARMTVNDYSTTAYGLWARSSGAACPKSLADLNEYSNKKDTKDPWGSEYVMYCGSNMPPGAKMFAVSSNGPDRQQGTADDIKSWE